LALSATTGHHRVVSAATATVVVSSGALTVLVTFTVMPHLIHGPSPVDPPADLLEAPHHPDPTPG
jgi:hypothetical protein